MAMYCAVQGPTPGSFSSAATVAGTSAEGSSRRRPAATSFASATMARARAPITPREAISEGSSAASLAAVGKRRLKPSRGVSIGSPKACTRRAAVPVAALTVTCCPRIARTAVSNPSTAPGSRKPGWFAASVPRTEAISSGRQARSKRCFTRERTEGRAPASDTSPPSPAGTTARRGCDGNPAGKPCRRSARGVRSLDARPPLHPESRAWRGRRASP